MAALSEPVPLWKEDDRLKAVASYGILDTPREEEFDDIARLAAQACDAPIALISFVDRDRQWFKAAIGTMLKETELDCSICLHAIRQKGVFVVEDTADDARTVRNPLVTGHPNVRFYAGANLETREGLPLGTVCVLDFKPRRMTSQEKVSLRILALLVMTQMELRLARKRLGAAQKA